MSAQSHTPADPPRSAPTRRVVDVLTALAGPPPRGLTLAELARETGASRATLHAVVAELVDAGWCARGADGRVFVGGVLVGLARSLVRDDDLAVRCHDALLELAETTGQAAYTTELRQDRLVVVDLVPGRGRTASPPLLGMGTSTAVRAPFGRAVAASWDDDGLARWFDDGEAGPAIRQRLGRVLPQIRRRGWSLERLSPGRRELVRMAGALEQAGIGTQVRERVAEVFAELGELDALDTEVGDAADLDVAFLTAPVLDPAGRVVGTIGTTPGRRMTGRTVRGTADLVATVARAC